MITKIEKEKQKEELYLITLVSIFFVPVTYLIGLYWFVIVE